MRALFMRIDTGQAVLVGGGQRFVPALLIRQPAILIGIKVDACPVHRIIHHKELDRVRVWHSWFSGSDGVGATLGAVFRRLVFVGGRPLMNIYRWWHKSFATWCTRIAHCTLHIVLPRVCARRLSGRRRISVLPTVLPRV